MQNGYIRNRVTLPIWDGEVRAAFCTFGGMPEAEEHFAIEFGTRRSDQPLVRIHSECITGDMFGSQRCDCGPQLAEAVKRLSEEGGILIYLRQEGRGIGLYAKLDAYSLQDQGYDTFEANQRLHFKDDLRDYRSAAVMLQALGAPSIRLLSNNPDKIAQLERYGVRIVEQINTGVFVNRHNRDYLEAKVKKAGHRITLTQERSHETRRAD